MVRRGLRRSLLAALICGASSLASASGTWASQTASLRVGFAPYTLGRGTTVSVGFTIHPREAELPSPLTNVAVRLPAGLLFGSSTLGVATCTAATLSDAGVGGCPGNAVMGHGSARVGIRLGPEVLYEQADVTLLMAPLTEGHTTVLFYASGTTPVIARLIFPSLLLEASGPFSGSLDTNVPPITGLPGAPDAALLRLNSNIGPKGLTYHRRSHGVVVGYTPEGFLLPARCPRGGFLFEAVFSFQDGSVIHSKRAVRCPGDARPTATPKAQTPKPTHLKQL